MEADSFLPPPQVTKPQSANLLDLEGAAAYLLTSVRHLRRLYSEGRVAYVKVGRYVRFRPADLDAFLAANSVASEG